jgi:hypothetical protein
MYVLLLFMTDFQAKKRKTNNIIFLLFMENQQVLNSGLNSHMQSFAMRTLHFLLVHTDLQYKYFFQH